MNINTVRIGSSLVMILALCWLTVSLPYVTRAKQQYAASKTAKQDSNSNQLPNTTEEKTPQTINEEYLHHEELAANQSLNTSPVYNHHVSTDLPHFHSELISPPPEA